MEKPMPYFGAIAEFEEDGESVHFFHESLIHPNDIEALAKWLLEVAAWMRKTEE